jgi:hypothetical protein
MELQIGTGWHGGKHRDSSSPRQICRAPLKQRRQNRAWGSGESRLPSLILANERRFVESESGAKSRSPHRYVGVSGLNLSEGP